MSIALASRGYLCPRRGVDQVGPGPTIVGIEAQAPNLLGAQLDVVEGPTISGAGPQVPQIDGGSAAQSPPGPDAPVISGGGVQVPQIDGGEES